MRFSCLPLLLAPLALAGCDWAPPAADVADGSADADATTPAPDDGGIPPGLDCVGNGGTCVTIDQGWPGCGAGKRLGDSLECPSQPDGEQGCCVSAPPDLCDIASGACTLPDAGCPVGLMPATSGCAQSGARSQCCAPLTACLQQGGFCVSQTGSCGAFGAYYPLDDQPAVMCQGATGPVCCLNHPIDACGQAGGTCTASGDAQACPQPIDAGCNRPAAVGPWVCCP
ncbi:MAG: hypothetical protein ABSE49_02900 [Polyangiaceae bacterium]|jgi:hypothetical protein